MFRKLISAVLLPLFLLNFIVSTQAQQDKNAQMPEDVNADLPRVVRKQIGKQSYLLERSKNLALLRGLPYPKPDARNKAVYEMMRQENALRAATGQPDAAPSAFWQPLGPAPIPEGQTSVRRDPVSGRTSAIAVHPTNPNIAYVGTADGGLYRTLNGGATWTALLDNALTLAIGSVAIAPSDPTIVYVGTGEPALPGFFGVGIYRITNADTNPVVAGPLNRNASNQDVFTGLSVSKIVVHPTNPNVLFASTVFGSAGLGFDFPVSIPARGLFRTTNALAASPAFEKINVITSGGSNNRDIVDIVMEPGNPNRLLASVLAFQGADFGVYLTTNALDAAPAFTRTLTTALGTGARTELAINKVGSAVTVIAASGLGDGSVFRSTDGGTSFVPAAQNGFCGGQCFFNIGVAIDPNDANIVYIGGQTNPMFAKSTNGGANFTTSQVGLHADTHAITVAPSNPNVIYVGNDGGIWRSDDGGNNWLSRNTAGYSATQFQSLALHPTDRHWLIGGTQDNGTNFLEPNGTAWVHSDDGDGGFTAVDRNATSPTSIVAAYHTYFNIQNFLIGFTVATTTVPNGDPIWGNFLGCIQGTSNNGIACADDTLFYAPLVLGPGNPSTLYFGTDKLYRSTNLGTTMTPVSQALGVPVSAISISPQNDNVRVVGTATGGLFATSSGSATLTDIDPAGIVPNQFVGRIAVDPTNQNTVYVALGGFGVPAGQHVWKGTNLSSGAPVWTAAGNGIPDIPVNGFAVDPANPNNLYAGTDIGVFRSTDGGVSWQPFSDGLPRVAVFDMAIQPVHRVLRIATHGRGIWEMNLNAPVTRRPPADFDGDGRTDLSVFRNGSWFITNSSNNQFRGIAFGQAGDIIAPGDFDGDGKTDTAVFRAGNWFILNSSNNAFRSVAFGQAGDRPVAADYDGDGKADTAVFRAGNWFILNSSNNAVRVAAFGLSDDLPTPGDYDADGKADVAVFRSSNGGWFALKSSDGGVIAQQFGQAGDKPVAADYDADGRTDFAVFRPSNGGWYIQQTTAGFRGLQFGISTDIPSQGDFDGDGRTDFAVFRNGNWYISLNVNNQFRAEFFGQAGDIPIPSGYNPLQ